MFASTSLAARIERTERRLIEDSAAAAARRHPEARGFVSPISGGIAAFTTEGSPLNKVAGLGFAGPVDERQLEAVEKAFAERESPVQVELSCLSGLMCSEFEGPRVGHQMSETDPGHVSLPTTY